MGFTTGSSKSTAMCVSPGNVAVTAQFGSFGATQHSAVETIMLPSNRGNEEPSRISDQGVGAYFCPI
jgi:hypothetical protein